MNVSRGRSILTNMKIKILIADDNSFIREGMKIILN
ncbi:DNA-binding response regulator, partial [Bacillus sp. B-TM1]